MSDQQEIGAVTGQQKQLPDLKNISGPVHESKGRGKSKNVKQVLYKPKQRFEDKEQTMFAFANPISLRHDGSREKFLPQYGENYWRGRARGRGGQYRGSAHSYFDHPRQRELEEDWTEADSNTYRQESEWNSQR